MVISHIIGTNMPANQKCQAMQRQQPSTQACKWCTNFLYILTFVAHLVDDSVFELTNNREVRYRVTNRQKKTDRPNYSNPCSPRINKKAPKCKSKVLWCISELHAVSCCFLSWNCSACVVRRKKWYMWYVYELHWEKTHFNTFLFAINIALLNLTLLQIACWLIQHELCCTIPVTFVMY